MIRLESHEVGPHGRRGVLDDILLQRPSSGSLVLTYGEPSTPCFVHDGGYILRMRLEGVVFAARKYGHTTSLERSCIPPSQVSVTVMTFFSTIYPWISKHWKISSISCCCTGPSAQHLPCPAYTRTFSICPFIHHTEIIIHDTAMRAMIVSFWRLEYYSCYTSDEARKDNVITVTDERVSSCGRTNHYLQTLF